MKSRIFLFLFTIFLLSNIYCCSNNTSTTNLEDNSNSTPIPEEYLDNGIFSKYYDDAYKKLIKMPLEEKVGQLILAKCPTGNEINEISKYNFGGFVLFSEDIDNKTRSELKENINTFQASSKIPMLIAVDEEGGTVVRVSSNPNIRSTIFNSPQKIYYYYGMDGIISDTIEKDKLLKSLGINMNLAPVADVSTNSNNYIYKRSFGKSAQDTSEFVKNVVEASKKEKIASVLKHFPGYGNNIDTHNEIAIDYRPYSTFLNSDFLPFQAGISAGVECILVSHIIVNVIDKDTPSSLSKITHDILRNDLGFTGVIITDDLSMGAITNYNSDINPAIKAIQAGNDLLIVSNYAEAYDSILNGVKNGDISEDLIDRAVLRILSLKYSLGIMKW